MKRIRAPLQWTAVLLLVACTGSSSTEPVNVPGTLGPGRWGGPSAVLDIAGGDSATVRFDFCADGRLPVPILLAPDGRFDVAGTYVRNIGPSIQARAARYIGLWRPSSLTLTVFLSEPLGPNESDVVGPFDLFPDNPGPPPHPCPIAY